VISMPSSPTLSEAAPEYWKSPAGITRRVEMLSQSFTYKVVNNALLIYGETGGVKRWRWVTTGDERVCPICGALAGRVYRVGQFLPSMPAHVFCRCRWEIMFNPKEIPKYVV